MIVHIPLIEMNYFILSKNKIMTQEEKEKEVPKNYYGEITYNSDWEKHIEHMLSDDWEGNEVIFLTEDECSKPFNTPKILGCIDNLNDIIE